MTQKIIFLTNQLNYAALTGSQSIVAVVVDDVDVVVVVVKMQKGGNLVTFWPQEDIYKIIRIFSSVLCNNEF